MKCLICKIPILRDKTFLLNAARLSINTNYGSRFDTLSFSAIICDNCIAALIKNKDLSIVDDFSKSIIKPKDIESILHF